MDWSKLASLGSKAQDIFQMGKDAFGDGSETVDTEKSLFGKQEKEEIEQLNAQIEAEKKKQQNTLMYAVGAVLILMFTGILKIGK